ncbi:hypothetical protein RJ639_007368 [Escallonia herrerae]|uniref:Lysosomal Pro-X carboxypeptidase n=1 Tax=Escallonia herrerae TaxID=1293975 RepID=A0AA88VXW8_9ASTE|nr:hypothetical protein RJ639_007368 [Escallonia herrerae]
MAKPLILSSFLAVLLLSLSPLSLESAPGRRLGSSKRAPCFFGKFSHPHTNKLSNPRNPKYRYDTRYFDQRLDHFSFADLPNFPQRYLINTEHWVGPARMGPIFFTAATRGILSGSPTTPASFGKSRLALVPWSSSPKLSIMSLKHRYYGESMPYGSRDEAYRNATTLAHLTTEQALADFAVLITNLKRNLSAETCPVVLFGGSYGGMLAAWMRLKYPQIAIGALASSAPVLQFEDIVPPETFYDIVSNDFRVRNALTFFFSLTTFHRESTSCFNTIKESWDIVEAEGQKKNGLVELTKTFGLCRVIELNDRKLERSEDLSDWLDSAYSYLAMANYPYPTEFLMPLPGNPIKEVCRKIDSCPDGTSVLDRVFEGVSVYYNYTGEVDCFELDDDPHGMDGWNWQACSEMVMPMSSTRDSSMFPEYNFSYSLFEEGCWNDYRVKSRPTWITTEFGGHGFKAALKIFGSNIIFSNGLLDPWSGGSVLGNISKSIIALVTEKGAHHIDLRAATVNDPDWVVEQRAAEVKVIEGWIKDYYQEKKAVFDM